MGFNQHTLSNEEYLTRLKTLMPILNARQQGKEHIQEMFFLYNDRLLPREQRSGCGQCVRRVYDRITKYYNELTA